MHYFGLYLSKDAFFCAQRIYFISFMGRAHLSPRFRITEKLGQIVTRGTFLITYPSSLFIGTVECWM